MAKLKSPEEIEAMGYLITYDEEGNTFSLKTKSKYPVTVSGYRKEWFDKYHPVIDDVYSVHKSVIDNWPEVFKLKDNTARLKADHLLPEGIAVMGWADDGSMLRIQQGEKVMYISTEMQQHWHTIYDMEYPIQRSLVEAIYSNVFMVKG